MVKRILQLGEPALYERCAEVEAEELGGLRGVVEDMHDTLIDFRNTYGRGRAIAAPQIGVQKRIIYVYINAPAILLNPVLEYPDGEMMEVMDDCMSFPGLWVRVKRYKRCVIHYRNLDWLRREVLLQDDMAELAQHETDHLDGVLATMRAVDSKSFYTFPPGKKPK